MIREGIHMYASLSLYFFSLRVNGFLPDGVEL